MAGGQRGGAEAFFDRLLPAFAASGLEQRALVRPSPERCQSLKAAGIDVVPLRFGGPIDLPSRWRFRAEARHYGPEIVMTWMRRATAACPKGRFVHVARLGGYYKLAHFTCCDHLIGNTEALCSYMRAGGIPADRVHYLPNFVSAEAIQPVPREQHNTPGDASLVLALGRLHPFKAFDVLLHAMVELPGVYLWILGEGPEREKLVNLRRHLGLENRVRLIGWQEAPAAYYAAADVVVCSSRQEALGNTIIEAWAQLRPVVATLAAGPRALIKDRRTGLLVPIDDAVALSQAIAQVISSAQLAAGLAKAGHAAYRKSFTETVVVEAYKELFREFLR